MPTLNAAQIERTYFFDEPFDTTPPTALDALLGADPMPERASLATVIGLFLTLALLQVGVSALIVLTFDLSGFRIALVYVVAAPALLYAIIAAWDHRQLRVSGHPNPTPWGWALVFPPVYLILRWATATTGGNDRMRTVFGWAVAQAIVTLSLVLLIVVGVVASAAPSADAAGDPASVSDVSIPSVSDDDSATRLTADGIENAVVDIWARSGATGTVFCPEGFSTEPGTFVTCHGALEGEPLSFTVIVTEVATDEIPWTFASWTPAG